MEQDEKQILYCKLKVRSRQAQRRRKVMLWELRINNERLPAACLPQVICGAVHVSSHAQSIPMAEPLKTLPKLRIIFLLFQVIAGSWLAPHIQKVSGLSHKILKATVVCPHLLTAWIRRRSQKTQHLSSRENCTSKKKVATVKEVKSQPWQTFEAGGEDVN